MADHEPAAHEDELATATPSSGEGHGDHGHGADPDPEIRLSPLVKGIAAIFAVGIGFAILLWPMSMAFKALAERRAEVTAPLDQSRPAGPRLQPNPPVDMEQLRRQEAAVLESYGWVDRERGLAQVPVERAAELTIEHGLGAILASTPTPVEPEEAPE